MKLSLREYIWYKFFNSLFFGISVGSIFILYTPLEPSIYSLGGILLALGMLIIAKYYDRLMDLKTFFYITLLVEFVVLCFVVFFLLFNYSYMSALVVYIGYQVTFVFGNYLVRMETIVLKKPILLSFTDVAKQKAYLIGLVFSYVAYKAFEYFEIIDKQIQVYNLHVGMFFLQVLIIYLVLKSFRKLIK